MEMFGKFVENAFLVPEEPLSPESEGFSNDSAETKEMFEGVTSEIGFAEETFFGDFTSRMTTGNVPRINTVPEYPQIFIPYIKKVVLDGSQKSRKFPFYRDIGKINEGDVINIKTERRGGEIVTVVKRISSETVPTERRYNCHPKEWRWN